MPDTPEFKVALSKMRADISSAITAAIGTFSAQTGVTPSAVTFDMVDVSTMSDYPKRVSVLGGVRFRFTDQ